MIFQLGLFENFYLRNLQKYNNEKKKDQPTLSLKLLTAKLNSGTLFSL